MRIKSDLTGKRFGLLVVIEHAGKAHNGKSLWLCQCDCGNKKVLQHRSLVHDRITGCGCRQKERHEISSPYTYMSWSCLKSRCIRGKRYLDKGIKVCDRWINSFNAFFEDMGERPKGTIIDRINNDGNYEPGNCRWATPTVNANNRCNSINVTYNGETKTLAEWSEQMGINYRTLHDRIKKMSIHEALSKPVGRWK